jgi:hypothetical protein
LKLNAKNNTLKNEARKSRREFSTHAFLLDILLEFYILDLSLCQGCEPGGMTEHRTRKRQ